MSVFILFVTMTIVLFSRFRHSKRLSSNMQINKIVIVFFVLISFEIIIVLIQTLLKKKWQLRHIKIKIVFLMILLIFEIICLTLQINTNARAIQCLFINDSSEKKIFERVVWTIVYCTIFLSSFVKIITNFKSNFSKINLHQIAHWFHFIIYDWRQQIDFKLNQSQVDTSKINLLKSIVMKFIVFRNWREIHVIIIFWIIKIDVVVW